MKLNLRRSATRPKSDTQLTRPIGLRKWSGQRRLVSRRVVIIIGAVVLLAVVIIGAFLFYHYRSQPVHITDLTLRQELSSRTSDAPIKQSYKVGEPIMLSFSFHDAAVQTQITAELKKGNDVVRSYHVPALRPDEGSSNNGTRYISIVNTATTKLGVGSYTVVLYGDATKQQELAKSSFTVQ